MSWEDYVDFMRAGGVIEDAAILDKNAQIYATSFGLIKGMHLPVYKITVVDPEDNEKKSELDYDEAFIILDSIQHIYLEV